MDALKSVGNIQLLGTVHISSESADLVKKIIDEWHPDVVMLELDEMRLQTLMETKKEINDSQVQHKKTNRNNEKKQTIDPSTSLLENFHALQQQLSTEMGVAAGSEMIAAYQICTERKIKILPIDKPIELIAAELSQQISEETKQEIQNDFEQSASTGEMQESYDEFMENIQNPEGMDIILNEFQSEYPELYEILLQGRNKYMIQRIRDYVAENPTHKVLIVVGMGHLNPLFEMLKQNI